MDILDTSFDHLRSDRMRDKQIVGVRGDHVPHAGFPDTVAGAPHSLQAAGHRCGGLDLDDDINLAHIDAQFHAAGCHDSAKSTLFQVIFDRATDFLRNRAMVSTGERHLQSGNFPFLRALIDPGRKAFG